MSNYAEKPQRGELLLLLTAVTLFLASPGAIETAHGQPPEKRLTAPVDDGAVSEAKAEQLAHLISGEWVGARLLCRKEEDNSVRCGKPVNFSVTFYEDRTGTSTDEHFPSSFSYRWKSKSELILTPAQGGDELTLFQIELREGYLSFQAYVYLALKDPTLPKEANYIHYIFDVHRLD